MKNSIIILLIVFSISIVFSQEGKYCKEFDFTKICYELKENNRFEFNNYLCVGIIKGQGRYELKDSAITFYYEPMKYFENPISISKINKNSENIEIDLYVRDFESGNLIDDYSVFQRYWGKDPKKIKHTNNHILIEYEGKPNNVIISHPKFSEQIFEIKEKGKYKVEIFLLAGNKGFGLEMKEGVYTFSIIKFDKKEIILFNENYNYKLILQQE